MKCERLRRTESAQFRGDHSRGEAYRRQFTARPAAQRCMAKPANKPCAASANGAPPLAVNLPKAVKLANAQGNDKDWRLWAEAGCTVAQLHSCIPAAKEGEYADWVSNFDNPNEATPQSMRGDLNSPVP